MIQRETSSESFYSIDVFTGKHWSVMRKGCAMIVGLMLKSNVAVEFWTFWTLSIKIYCNNLIQAEQMQ